MLDSFVSQLGKELDMAELIISPEKGHFRLPFEGNVEVDAIQSHEGYYGFKGVIGNLDESKARDFLTKVMEANLFGKQTRGSIIGLNEEGKVLTLSTEVDYNSSYKEWRDKLEDFVSVLQFWKKEAG